MATNKKKKGKTMPLTEFIASDRKLVAVRASNWSEIVDSEEAETKPIVVDLGVLPTAPRAAHDIDYSTVPNTPPFVAHVANLSFEIDDEHLRRIFADLNPKSARIIRDGIRSRGVGLVEFETRENLIDALKKTDKELYGRKIRVNVSDKTDSHADGGRGGFSNNRSYRSGEERPEMADRWKRAENRSDDTSDDRPSNNFNRDRQNRGDFARTSMGGNSRDNQHGNDYGFGYPRQRDDRGGASGGNRDRDHNRQGQRNRHQDDNYRPSSGADRPRYAGRYSDTRDTRDRNQPNDEAPDDQREAPRERQRLQLKPRSKPLEENQPLSGSSSSINNLGTNTNQPSMSNPDESPTNQNTDEYKQQESGDSTDNTSRVNTTDEQTTVKPIRGAGASIFGGAKPVDTTARELEIEKKMKELQMNTETSVDTENKGTSSRPYNRGGERDNYRSKRGPQNEDHRDRRDNGRSGHGVDYHHKREFSGGRQFEDDGRKRSDDHHRRGGGGSGGGYDRDRYGGPSRRDHDSGRSSKYGQQNPPERDTERGNYRQRDRDHETNEFNNPGRSSNNNFNAEPPSRNQQRGTARRTLKTEDDSHKLHLSNKFGMLDDDELDDNIEKDNDEDVQSPSIDD